MSIKCFKNSALNEFFSTADKIEYSCANCKIKTMGIILMHPKNWQYIFPKNAKFDFLDEYLYCPKCSKVINIIK